MRTIQTLRQWIEANAPELTNKTIITLSMEGNIPEFEGYEAQDANTIGGLGVYFGDKLEGLYDLGLKAYGIMPLYAKRYQGSLEVAVDYHPLKDRQIIQRVTDENGFPLTLQVYIWEEGDIHNPEKNSLIEVEVWKVCRGGSDLFLLWCPQVFDFLYPAGRVHRFTQEVVFGKSVYQLIKRLRLQPDILHLNEAHTVVAGALLRADEAFNQTAIVYTNHTIVPAGLERFYPKTMGTDANRMMYQIGIPGDKHLQFRSYFLPLGEEVVDFCYASVKLAERINGVSTEHAWVTERLFKELYGSEFQSSVVGVLNGSGKSWKNPRLRELEAQGRVPSPEQLWEIHQEAKAEALAEVEARTGISLDLAKLTLWAIRRIVDYKSQYPILRFLVHLICADRDTSFTKDQLRNLWFRDIPDLRSEEHQDLVEAVLDYLFRHQEVIKGLGVQVVVGGPAFEPFWVREFEKWTHSIAELKGRFVFIPSSGVRLLKIQAMGADLCINMPRPLEEACGTSDQRAGLNGGVNIALRGAGPVEWISDYQPETGEGNGFLFGPYVRYTPRGLVADLPLFYSKAPVDIYQKLALASYLYYHRLDQWKQLMYRSYQLANEKVTAIAMEQRYTRFVYLPALQRMREKDLVGL